MIHPTRFATARDEPQPVAPDAVADLERRMVDAELAGRQTVADAIARRLEALRTRAVGNVIQLKR